MKVVHYHRKARGNNFSIERLFRYIRAVMPDGIECEVRTSSHYSSGIYPRMCDILDSTKYEGDVNHITGDVHYLAFGLEPSKTIITIHDCGILHRTSGMKRILLKYLWFVWPTSHCAIVTTVSRATQQELVKYTGISREKIRVVYNCIGPEFSYRRKEFCKEKPTILVIGTAPNKNLSRYAEALEGINCLVEIIGTLSKKQESAFAYRGVKTRLLGQLNDESVRLAYERCDLLLFASLHEGFGMPIIEAQVTGRPVVTSNCSSMPEIAGKGAFYVDPYDASSIRAGIDLVINNVDYRNQLVSSGIRNAVRFSSENVAKSYADIYKEIYMYSHRREGCV